MPADYDGYYGLRQAPFTLTPDPRFAYSSPSQERALHVILHALSRREGLVVVTGDIGCGKTTLCRRLVPQLPPRTFLSLVLNPFLAADDLLKQVLEDFGLVSSTDVRGGALAHASCHELARTLQEFLNSLAGIDGTAVIIVDEAQNLPLRTLEQIRLLSNFETDTRKLLQIILVGQRNLEPILALDEMRQLNQRISRRCRIDPLSVSEVGEYVNYRLSVAASAASEAPTPERREASKVRFTTRSLRTVAKLSAGVPRIVNLLCDRALEIHAGKQAAIDHRLVIAAASDLELAVPISVRLPSFYPALGGAMAATAIAATAGWWIAAGSPLPAWVSGPRSPAPVDTAQARVTAPVQTPALNLQPSVRQAAVSETIEAQTPLRTVVEEVSSYQLTVASFETEGRAESVAGDLIALGHPARVSASESGRWQMVIVGPYTSAAEAETAKAILTKAGFAGIRIWKSG